MSKKLKYDPEHGFNKDKESVYQAMEAIFKKANGFTFRGRKFYILKSNDFKSRPTIELNNALYLEPCQYKFYYLNDVGQIEYTETGIVAISRMAREDLKFTAKDPKDNEELDKIRVHLAKVIDEDK